MSLAWRRNCKLTQSSEYGANRSSDRIDILYSRIGSHETVAVKGGSKRHVPESGRRESNTSHIPPDGTKPVRDTAAGASVRHVTGDERRTDETPARASTVITGAQRRGNALEKLVAPLTRIVGRSSNKEDLEVESGSPFRSDRSRRATRSSNAYDVDDYFLDEAGREEPRPKFSKTGGLGPEWKKPLCYNLGKKRETVNYDDLPRLDDDEFLNDNLVGFFLLYLESHLERSNPDLWKKTYIFNTYFYETLTQKGKKGVKYEGVDKWTRNIDLFKREFVVVPVNENLHWYVAIICNLTYFHDLMAGKLEDADDDPIHEADGKLEEALQESNSIQELEDPDTRPQVLSDQPHNAEETRSSFQNLHLDEAPVKDSPTTTHNSSRAPDSASKRAKGRSKSARKSLPARRYNPQHPVIITLDSLGSGRSSTCSALRQYIKLEAMQKKEWDIDETVIKGMTAKDIPTQSNYSDCGLYLCAYMEKFVLDPRGFVRHILQRETQIWPQMESSDLRARFRDVVLELYRRQEGEEVRKELPDVGRILLRASEPEIEAAADGEDEIQELQLGKSMLKKVNRVSATSGDDLQRPSTPEPLQDAGPSKLKTLSRVERDLERLSPPIAIPDDESPKVIFSRSIPKKDYSRKNHRRQNSIDDFIAPNDPKQLAQQMQNRRSPPDRHREQQRATPTSGQKMLEAMKRAEMVGEQETEMNKRRRRSDTVDTEHLSGIHTYAAHLDDEDERLEEEVPETQQEHQDHVQARVQNLRSEDTEMANDEADDMLV